MRLFCHSELGNQERLERRSCQLSKQGVHTYSVISGSVNFAITRLVQGPTQKCCRYQFATKFTLKVLVAVSTADAPCRSTWGGPAGIFSIPEAPTLSAVPATKRNCSHGMLCLCQMKWLRSTANFSVLKVHSIMLWQLRSCGEIQI